MKKCIICGSDNLVEIKARFRPFLIHRMFAKSPTPTHIAYCQQCGFECASHRPSQEDMQRYYDNYLEEDYIQDRELIEPGYIERFNAESLAVQDNLLACRNALASFLLPYVQDSKLATILDYGGGGARLFPWSCIMLSALSLIFPIKSLCKISLKSKTKMSFAHNALISSSAPIC